VIEHYAPDLGTGDITVQQVATGANPASIAAKNGLVAFGRGNQVVILQQSGTTWLDRGTIAAEAPVGRLAVDGNGDTIHAAFQAGTTVWFASSTTTGWKVDRVDDVHEPLTESPTFQAYEAYAAVLVHTGHASARYDRFENGRPFDAHHIGPTSAVAAAITSYFGIGSLVAVNENGGSTLYREGFPNGLFHLGTRATGMWMIYPSVFLQIEGGSVVVLMLNRQQTGARIAQIIPSIGTIDTVGDFGVAGGGVVYYPSGNSVFGASDPQKDNVDRDCDGAD